MEVTSEVLNLNKVDQIRQIYQKNSKLSNKEIARITGASKRHVRRVLNPIREKPKSPRILLVDIETAPLVCYTWGLFKQRISPDKVIADWSILSWAAKELFSSDIMSAVVTPREAIERKDGSIIRKLWQLYNDYDIIIGHNGKKFDNRRANARFILNGLPSPAPYKTIDTMLECKKNFAMSSYSLDYLAKTFGFTRKIKTEFQLWIDCVNGDPQALQEMVRYNAGDIIALEELYVSIRPYIKSHPNYACYVNATEPICPTCGCRDLTYSGYYYTQVGKYRSFRCDSCRSIGRLRVNELKPTPKTI